MKVYVLMGNDFPDAVFTSERRANEVAEERRAIEPGFKYSTGQIRAPRIYWCLDEFELDETP